MKTTLFASILLVLSATAASAGAVLDRIESARKLVIATDAAYPPQSFLDKDGVMKGFDVDVGTEIAKRFGVSVEFVTPTWDLVIAGRWGDRWDVSIGSMTPTEQRSTVLDFPSIYYYVAHVLVVHKDNTTINRPEDASGKRIGIGQGESYERYLAGNLVLDAVGAQRITYRIMGAQVQAFEGNAMALDSLKLGDGVRIDAAMTSLPTALAARKAGAPIRVIEPPVYHEPLAVAIDKNDPEFGARLKEIVAAMRADGTLKTLSLKWFGADLTSPVQE